MPRITKPSVEYLHLLSTRAALQLMGQCHMQLLPAGVWQQLGLLSTPGSSSLWATGTRHWSLAVMPTHVDMQFLKKMRA